MAHLTLAGTLNMLTAQIDWRDETARCVGVFRSDDHGALEVEYKVHLESGILDLLARAFLNAGLPVLRGSVAVASRITVLDGTPMTPTAQKIDRRKREWRERKSVVNGGNGDAPVTPSRAGDG